MAGYVLLPITSLVVMLCDNASAMQLLMQYPWISGGYASTWDVNDLVQLAVHFRKPEVSLGALLCVCMGDMHVRACASACAHAFVHTCVYFA